MLLERRMLAGATTTKVLILIVLEDALGVDIKSVEIITLERS